MYRLYGLNMYVYSLALPKLGRGRINALFLLQQQRAYMHAVLMSLCTFWELKAGCVTGNSPLFAGPLQPLCFINLFAGPSPTSLCRFSVNDDVEPELQANHVILSCERLLQRVLSLPGRPAVVYMHVRRVLHDWTTGVTVPQPFYHTR